MTLVLRDTVSNRKKPKKALDSFLRNGRKEQKLKWHAFPKKKLNA